MTTRCRYVTRSSILPSHTKHSNCCNNARRVLRKYKKMTLRREMRRLRQLLPRGEILQQYQVIDQTILLIQQLESKLLTRKKQGMIHPKISMMINEDNIKKLDV